MSTRDSDGRLRVEAPNSSWRLDGTMRESMTLYTDRPIGLYPQDATADGHVYVFDPGDWACPSRKYTLEQARAHAQALLLAADEIEAASGTD